MAWRYIASRLNGDGTETFLDWDLPLGDVRITKALSAPDAISAKIQPEILGMDDILIPWQTAVYAEQDGHVRAGGIIQDRKIRGDNLVFDAFGFASYPADMPYIGLPEVVFADKDPVEIVKWAWQYLQSFRGGNLGLELDLPSTPVRTGSAPPPEEQPRDEETGQFVEDDTPRAVVVTQDNTTDLAKLINDHVQSTPFEYIEEHSLRDDGTMRHVLKGAYPSFGRRRHDLRFMVGENCMNVPDAVSDGAEYASMVYLLGAGEGAAMIRQGKSRFGEERLRRVALVSDRSVTDYDQARLVLERELRLREGRTAITRLALIDHPNARVGSYQLGDEILVQTGPHGWARNINQWSRITEIEYSPDNPDVASLRLSPVA